MTDQRILPRVTFKVPRPDWIASEAGQATVASLWAEQDYTQVQIAKALGYTKPTTINMMIVKFIFRHVPRVCREVTVTFPPRPRQHAHDRKQLAITALARFRAGAR